MHIPPDVTFSDMKVDAKNWAKLQKERPRDRRRDDSFEDPLSYTMLPEGPSELQMELDNLREANVARRVMHQKLDKLLNDRRHELFECSLPESSDCTVSEFTRSETPWVGDGPDSLPPMNITSQRCFSFDPSEVGSTKMGSEREPLYSRLRSLIVASTTTLGSSIRRSPNKSSSHPNPSSNVRMEDHSEAFPPGVRNTTSKRTDNDANVVKQALSTLSRLFSKRRRSSHRRRESTTSTSAATFTTPTSAHMVSPRNIAGDDVQGGYDDDSGDGQGIYGASTLHSSTSRNAEIHTEETTDPSATSRRQQKTRRRKRVGVSLGRFEQYRRHKRRGRGGHGRDPYPPVREQTDDRDEDGRRTRTPAFVDSAALLASGTEEHPKRWQRQQEHEQELLRRKRKDGDKSARRSASTRYIPFHAKSGDAEDEKYSLLDL